MTVCLDFLLCLQLGAQGPLGLDRRPRMEEVTPALAAALWKNMAIRESFLDSEEAHREPQSLYRFFGRHDYAKLRGNPGLGFYSASGFRWKGDRIAWLGIRPVTPDAAAIPAQVWDAEFQSIAAQRHWKVDPRAPIRINGACVGGVVDPSPEEPNRGVCVEIQVNCPTGTLLYRFSIAQPTVQEAVHAALDWVLCCAASMRENGGRHGITEP